ncbi:MAG: rubrerythrin family protein [Evtepia sp.]
MELKGSKTEANLQKAFAGESQARNKYTYFASKAKKDGFEQIAGFFEETANNEKEHAKLWFKELGGIGTTEENLLAAAEGEHDEWVDMYKEMAIAAHDEGFHRIADMFTFVGKIEKSHEERYIKLLENLQADEVFKRGEIKVWYCRNCGHLEYGLEAPKECPVCGHPQAYFEVKVENY